MNTRQCAVLLAACVSVLLGGCLEDKTLELVITGETSGDFVQNETSSAWTHPAAIDVAQELRDILQANGYEESDLKRAHLTSMHYGVPAIDAGLHDWTITGSITVTYNGSTQTVLDYASLSVQAALGKKIPATLQSGGVNLINQALQDFIDGQNPVLVFRINNGSTTPAPSGADPMRFIWRAWLAVQVIVNQKVTVPDPF
jgi:hypothetical protein